MNAVDVFAQIENRRLAKQAWQRANVSKTHQYTKKWGDANRDKIREGNLRNRGTRASRWNMLFQNAKKRGLPVTLTREQFASFEGKPCHYCDLPLSGSGRSSGGVGLDRISNDKLIGYTFENLLPCCGLCNSIRSNILTVEEMLKIGPAVREIRLAREAAPGFDAPTDNAPRFPKSTNGPPNMSTRPPELPIDAPRQIVLKDGKILTVTAISWVGKDASP
jgi:hypothetical protein